MLEVVESKDGTLQFRSAHSGYTLTDRSIRPRPQITYSGVHGYFPCYTEKGVTGIVKTYGGSSVFQDIIDNFGLPNSQKYGLPYSAAVLHASLGGTVVMQSLKAPSASHGSVIIMMRARYGGLTLADTRTKPLQKLGWVFVGNTQNGGGLTYIEEEKKYYSSDLYDMVKELSSNTSTGGTPLKVDELDALTQQFISDRNPASTEPFNSAKLKMAFKTKTGLSYSDGTYTKTAAEVKGNTQDTNLYNNVFSKIETAVDKYVSRWKEVSAKPLEIDFYAVDIATRMRELFEEKRISKFTGISSWEDLELLVNNVSGGQTAEQVKDNIMHGGDQDFYFEIPIIWGMYKGKGKYGNNYQIDFFNTKGESDNHRPIMQSVLRDNKQGVVIQGSEKYVTLTNDFGLNSPLLLEAAYSPQGYFHGDFKFKVAKPEMFDAMGEVIQTFLKTAFTGNDGNLAIKYVAGGQLIDAPRVLDAPATAGLVNGAGIKSYGPAGDNLLDEMRKQITALDDPDESGVHRLSNIDFTRFLNEIGFVNSAGLTSYRFNGGHEGELKYMREFDWDFNLGDALKKKPALKDDKEFMVYLNKWKTDDDRDIRILQQMYMDAFSGKTDINVYNLLANKADYTLDFDYPYNVKVAMYNFANTGNTARTDIQTIFNTNINNVTIDQSISEKSRVNFQGRNVMWQGGNFEWIDNYTSRSVRVPTPFAMIPLLLDHYNRGFATSIAGMDFGKLGMVQPYTQRGYGNMTLAEKDRLLKNGINIVSPLEDGYVYLDSDIMNYHLNELSALQKFHNNSITNRIIKDCMIYSQRYKHVLNNDSSVDVIKKDINQILAKYASKVDDFEYDAFFKSPQDRFMGRLDHNIYIRFNNTIEYEYFNIVALPGKGL